MRIKLNEQELNKCKNLLYVKEMNMSSVELYIEYFNSDIKIQKNDIKSTYSDTFLDKMDIEKDDQEFTEINDVCHIDSMKELSIDKYISNPYLVELNNLKNNGLIKWLKYEPYQGFVYDEIIVGQDDYSETTPFGYFTKEFKYPALIKNDYIWMSLIPHEMNTMEKDIDRAYGNVLVLGLGLGYYSYMISNKDDVESVTIIEKDKEIIDIFNKHLETHFRNLNKITIIEEDAFKYIENNSYKYDFIYADLWHNAGDGTGMYLKLKGLEKYNKSATYAYWIETTLISMIRRYILTIFEEALEGYADSDYRKAKDENDKIINCLYFKLKDYIVASFEDLHSLLSEDSIRKIASELNY